MTSVFEPITLGRLTLRNRVIKTATYEGMVVDGLPSEVLLRHHAELARGGVAMTTIAYCSVSPEGRTFRNQMVMQPASVPALRVLTDAVHREGAAEVRSVPRAASTPTGRSRACRSPAP
jgi:2,4-dienoyl-CoA reductase-like NADH-dependent reductase (Old Yellow Enzyme family)